MAMSVLEHDFLVNTPKLLQTLIEEVKELREEVKKLKNELNKGESK